MSQREDHLAYGHYYSQDGSRSGAGESARGLVGDTFKKLKSTYKSHQGSPAQSQQAGSNQQQSHNPGGYGQQPNQSQTPNPPYQNPQSQGKPPKQDKVSGLLGKLQGTVADFGGEFAQRIGTALDPQAYAEYGQQNPDTDYRFGSFAPARQGNDVKWYVDGCSYFYAVSKALENARESVWILDWWLSPELYLRRPPAKNEQYRLDRLLQAAAQRGVRVNIIVYKEVTQALTLSSSHTKHHLENLHPNIAVFRHPDHLPDAQELTASITSSLQHFSLDAASLAKMPGEAIKGIYGMNDDVILYWAHHEKLCLIDGRVAFMGGLDLCFGRWDTNQHSLSDVHPTDLNEIVFPGQDYNNARVLDFQDVSHWEQNQLDRKSASRMGWSDVALSLHGRVVEDLRRHFVERWNFIYDAKYEVRKEQRYSRLALFGRPSSAVSQGSQSPQPGHEQQHGAGKLQSPQPQQPSQQPQQAPQWQQPQSPHPQQPSQQPQQAPQWQQPQSPQPQQPSQQPQQTLQWQQPQSPQPQQPSQQPQQTPQWQQPQSPQPQQPSQQPSQQPQQQAQPQWQQSQSQPQQQQPSPQQPHWQQPPQQAQQQPQLAELQASPGWQQQSQSQQPQQQPQQPQVSQEKPQWQQQQSTEYKPYRPDGASNTPPSQNSGSPTPSHQSPPPSYHAYEHQSTPQQYTYTGQSFPPPPPGAPPNKPNQLQTQQSQQGQQQGQQGQAPYFPPPPTQEGSQNQTRCVEDHEGTRGVGDLDRGFALPRRFKKDDLMQYSNNFRGQLAGQIHQYQDRLTTLGRPQGQARGNMSCQIVRSCSKWSHGSDTEHSIADAYSAIIRNSEHCVYIENQFFITATSDSQKPVKNKIGAAIVERILRAARAGQKYKIIVVIPCVPCFAGDLSDESTLGTRAIMEFQYNSINRGGNSIMELIAKEGYNPMEYIRFYNLRNYDRINLSGPLADAEQRSGVNYEEARKEQDVKTGGQGGYGPGAPRSAFDPSAPFQQYQNAARQMSDKPSSGQWDSVSSCYMLNGEDLRKVPWDGPAEAEIDAFVTEELYVHSKVMIADDRIVICGSANINDRSQLGDHDSEIAVIIEDYTPISSTMNGKSWTASRFAASLRRQLFRKHLGLLPPQDPQRPDANYEPAGVPNDADLDSPESQLVADPLADPLHNVWNTRARTNTEAFRKVFHSVPDDSVRDWATYKEFYGYYFHKADKQAYGEAKDAAPARYRYGHVVRDNFPPGPEGVKQVKELLSQVKGTLVEMPLMFLIQEDVAKEGLTLNEVTEPIYT